MKKALRRLLLLESGIAAGLFLSEALARRGITGFSWAAMLISAGACSLVYLLSWPLGLAVTASLLGREKEGAAPWAVPAYLLTNVLLIYVATVTREPTAAPEHFAVKTLGLALSVLLLYFALLLFRRAYREWSFVLPLLVFLAAAVLGQLLHGELVRHGYNLLIPGLLDVLVTEPVQSALLAKIAWLSALWISLAAAGLAGFLARRRSWSAAWTLSIVFLSITVFWGAILFSSSRGKEDIVKVLESIPPGDPPVMPIRASTQPIVKKVEIAGESRNALYIAPPDSLTFEMEAPGRGILRIGFGILENAWNRKGDGVSFAVSTSGAGGRRTSLGSLFLDPASRKRDRRWVDFSASLDSVTGSRLEVTVVVRGGEDLRNEDTAFDYAAVSFPDFVPARRQKDPPNIILLLIDTLRADRLGCYGSANPTPHIDALAGAGVLFERAVSTSPWTNPSVFTIHTSLYPSDLWNPMPYDEAIRQVVPREVSTLAERLRENGYWNEAITDHPGISDETGYLQGFERIMKFFKMHSDKSPWGVTTEEDARRLEEETERILGDLGGGPFFLYLHLIYPHYPYAPPDSYRLRTTRAPLRHPVPLDPGRADVLSALYDAEVLLTDGYVGFLVALLEELEVDENTVLVLTSDHGEGFLEHGLLEHGNSLFQELLSVPLIVRAPGIFPDPERVSAKVSLVDLAPTLLDLAGLAPGPELRGRSLLAVMRAVEEDIPPLCYSEFQYAGDIGGKSVQDRRTKLIWDSGSRSFAVYDLAKDPLETDPAKKMPTRSEAGEILPDHSLALLQFTAAAEEGIVIWCEGLTYLALDARAGAGFKAVRGTMSVGRAAFSHDSTQVSFRADSLHAWEALVLTPNDSRARAEITIREILTRTGEAGLCVGPERIEWGGRSLTVVPGESPFAWDLLTRPRPSFLGAPGLWIWAVRKNHTGEAALSEETIDMLRAMGYIQ